MSGSQQLLLGGIPTAVPVDPYFYSVTSLLHGDGVNGGQNNTFLDSSSNNFTITRNGNTTQGSFSPFSQTGWSNYFDGTGDALGAPANAAFSYGTGDFTYEAWIYPTADGTATTYRFLMGAGGSGQQDQFLINNTGDQTLVYGDGVSGFVTTNKFTLNAWNHVAVSRNSGTLRVFINGVVGASGASTANITVGGSQTFWIGNRSGGADSPQQAFIGYMSNVRVLKGVGLYTSNFTPSTTPLTAISGTSLLTCQANRFLDASSNNFTITRNGDVSVQPFSPFNPTTPYSTSAVGGSGYFDGSGDYLQAASSSLLALSGDFTVETWLYYTGAATGMTPAILYNSSTSGVSAFEINNGSTYISLAGIATTDTVVRYNLTGASIGPNQWVHIAFVRSSNVIKAYVNGVAVATTLSNSATTGEIVQIANGRSAGAGGQVVGYMADYRIVSSAVYTANFTPPTAPLTAIANTRILLNFTNGAIFDNAAVADYETVGNAQISTSVKKYGTGSIAFDGTGDRLVAPNNGAVLTLGTGDFTVEMWVYANTVATTWQGLIDWRPSDTSTYPALVLNTSTIKWVKFGGAMITSFAISASTWYHVAICRAGSSTKLFINGTQAGSTYTDTNDYLSASTIRVGSTFASEDLNGYIDDLRVSKGVARYLYNFTPPTAEFPNIGGTVTLTADPYFDYTTLLLPGNGTNGAQNNTFLDSSTNAFSITRNGNTTQGTFSPFSQTGWGNYFDGSGDYLTVGSNAALGMGTGDFTVELWFYYTATPSNEFLFDFRYAGGSLLAAASGTFGVDVYVGAGNRSGGTVAANNWYHLAVTRSGSTCYVFLNGTQVGATFSDSTNLATGGVSIASRFNVPTQVFPGYISNFRVVKGTAVYTSNFTPSTTPLTAITNTSLLTCQSNRFIDNSTNNFAITRNGDVSVQAFSPFNPTAAWSAATNGGSGYFDGSGDYLTVAATSSLAFGSGDYTIEGWFYVTGTSDYFVFDMRTASGIYAYVEGSTGNNFVVATSGIAQSNAGTYRVNAWNHFAFVRSGSGSNNTSIYLNGTRTLQGTDTTNYSSNTGVYVGARYTATAPFVGYISDFRCVKGTAVYSGATYTVPTAPLTAITNTSLLLNYTNAGIYDATSKNDLETVGNAQISTTQSKFGGSSMYFDGTGDYCLFPVSQNFAFGTGDFTLECWIRTNRVTQSLFGLESGTGSYGLVFSAGDLYWQSSTMVTNLMNASATSILDNNWHHVALTRYNGTSRMFFDGVQVASVADSTSYTATTKMNVGYQHTSTNYYLGYIQDIRITKGIARYTSNFTPPTTAFLTL